MKGKNMDEILEAISERLHRIQDQLPNASEKGGYKPDVTYIPIPWTSDHPLGVDENGDQIFALWNMDDSEYLSTHNNDYFLISIKDLQKETVIDFLEQLESTPENRGKSVLDDQGVREFMEVMYNFEGEVPHSKALHLQNCS